jgi:hypothetical protein
VPLSARRSQGAVWGGSPRHSGLGRGHRAHPSALMALVLGQQHGPDAECPPPRGALPPQGPHRRLAGRPPGLRAQAAWAARPGVGARGRHSPYHHWGAPSVRPWGGGQCLMGLWPHPYQQTPGITSQLLTGPALQDTGCLTPDTCAGSGRIWPRRPTLRSGLDALRWSGLSRPHTR